MICRICGCKPDFPIAVAVPTGTGAFAVIEECLECRIFFHFLEEEMSEAA